MFEEEFAEVVIPDEWGVELEDIGRGFRRAGSAWGVVTYVGPTYGFIQELDSSEGYEFFVPFNMVRGKRLVKEDIVRFQ